MVAAIRRAASAFASRSALISRAQGIAVRRGLAEGRSFRVGLVQLGFQSFVFQAELGFRGAARHQSTDSSSSETAASKRCLTRSNLADFCIVVAVTKAFPKSTMVRNESLHWAVQRIGRKEQSRQYPNDLKAEVKAAIEDDRVENLLTRGPPLYKCAAMRAFSSIAFHDRRSFRPDRSGGASGREYFGAAHRLNGFAFCDAS